MLYEIMENLVIKQNKQCFQKKTTATARARDLVMAMPRIRAVINNFTSTVRDFINQEIEPIRKEMLEQIKVL